MTIDFFDAKPPGKDAPIITFYTSGLDGIERLQQTVVERHEVVPGASTASNTAGFPPGDIRIRGVWRGTKASDMASRLRDDVLSDTDIEKLELKAGDSNGAVSSPYNGTYRIGGQSRVFQPDSERDALWQYELILIEV